MCRGGEVRALSETYFTGEGRGRHERETRPRVSLQPKSSEPALKSTAIKERHTNGTHVSKRKKAPDRRTSKNKNIRKTKTDNSAKPS